MSIIQLGFFKGIPLYIDPYMEDYKIIAGRKGGDTQKKFFIANKKNNTINIIITKKEKIK